MPTALFAFTNQTTYEIRGYAFGLLLASKNFLLVFSKTIIASHCQNLSINDSNFKEFDKYIFLIKRSNKEEYNQVIKSTLKAAIVFILLSIIFLYKGRGSYNNYKKLEGKQIKEGNKKTFMKLDKTSHGNDDEVFSKYGVLNESIFSESDVDISEEEDQNIEREKRELQ